MSEWLYYCLARVKLRDHKQLTCHTDNFMNVGENINNTVPFLVLKIVFFFTLVKIELLNINHYENTEYNEFRMELHEVWPNLVQLAVIQLKTVYLVLIYPSV